MSSEFAWNPSTTPKPSFNLEISSNRILTCVSNRVESWNTCQNVLKPGLSYHRVEVGQHPSGEKRRSGNQQLLAFLVALETVALFCYFALKIWHMSRGFSGKQWLTFESGVSTGWPRDCSLTPTRKTTLEQCVVFC